MHQSVARLYHCRIRILHCAGAVFKHDMEKAYYRTFLSMAALVKPNKELNQMVEQAETAVGMKENFNGNIISLPAN